MSKIPRELFLEIVRDVSTGTFIGISLWQVAISFLRWVHGGVLCGTSPAFR